MTNLKNLILVMSVLTLASVAGLNAMYTGESSSSVTTTLAPDIDESVDLPFSNLPDEEFYEYLQELEILSSGEKKDNTEEKSQVSKGKEIAATKGERICPICQDFISSNDQIQLAACDHEFHKKCLESWVLTRRIMSKKCPVCRQDMKEFNKKYKGSQSDVPAENIVTLGELIRREIQPNATPPSIVRNFQSNLMTGFRDQAVSPSIIRIPPTEFTVRGPRSRRTHRTHFHQNAQLVQITTRRPSILQNLFRRRQ